MKILILGANGMLGSTLFRFLGASSESFEVVGTVRDVSLVNAFADVENGNVLVEPEILDPIRMIAILAETRPDVVINCIGIIKQVSSAEDPLVTLPINSLFPHQLEQICRLAHVRLVHISTDCVFTGNKGNYTENDIADAHDLYGKSKFIGEVVGQNSITLRTSIIGHELTTAHSLLNWFLMQKGSVMGYTNAIFSGLPTVELARVIRDYVLPDHNLFGLYHVSVEPISKFELLKIVRQVYDKNIDIIPDNQVIIDRSLDSSRFRQKTGFAPRGWLDMITAMHQFR